MPHHNLRPQWMREEATGIFSLFMRWQTCCRFVFPGYTSEPEGMGQNNFPTLRSANTSDSKSVH